MNRRKRHLRCKVRIVALEVEVYGRVVSESLRWEIEHEDTQSSGCLAAEARVATGSYHLLADVVKRHDTGKPIGPTDDEARLKERWLAQPVRPSPTQAVRY